MHSVQRSHWQIRLLLDSFRFCCQRLYCCAIVKVRLEEVEDYWLQCGAIPIEQSALGAFLGLMQEQDAW